MTVVHSTVATIAPWILLAATNRRGNQIGQRVDDTGMEITMFHILIAVAVIAIVAGLGWFVVRWRHQRQERSYNSTRGLFQELCRVHELSGGDRQLLRDMADWHGLSNPVQLFVEPDRFDSPEIIASMNAVQNITRLKATLFASSLS